MAIKIIAQSIAIMGDAENPCNRVSIKQKLIIMKKFLCKHRHGAITLALLLLSTLFSMGNTKRTPAWYTQSTSGNLCRTSTLPSGCDITVTGVICTTTVGSVITTWYVDNCVTVYYRQ
jgi:hypothetical protein